MMATTLTLREACAGGDMLDAVEASKDLHGVQRLTLLVHGYNDSACAAHAAYTSFLNTPELRDAAVRVSLGEIGLLYWPGDSRGLGPVSYPFEIPRARESATKLYDYLTDLGSASPLEVLFVCHSLGNRLVLALIDAHLKAPQPARMHLIGVLLMAAAVKVSMVEDTDELEPAAKAAGHTRVLCSTHDPVLKWAFGIGEFAAGEGFGTAVGRRGEPVPLWEAVQPMEQYNSHGAYWTEGATGPQVKIWLGLPVPRDLPVVLLPSESLPDPPVIGDRALPTRVIGSDLPTCGC